VCGEELSRETTTVAATGHTWDDGVVTVEPTETETGVKTYTCTVCGDTYTEVIPVTHTHVYTSEVTKEATCTEEGIITYTCSCGDTYTETIAKLECKAYDLGATDIDHTAWYHEAVNYALTEGFMTVYSDGTFGVNTTVTRAMLAEMLYKKEGSSSVTVDTNPFTDVSSDAWYYNSVMWANVNGIVTGYTGTTEFRPTNAVTRQEAAIMIVRYLIYKGELTSADLESVDTSVLDSYSDAGSISSWAEKYVALAVSEGIIHGYDNANELRPLNNITRAEMAQIIYNIFG
ncbi:MAG: S-layer homology domain-containing protein, partial [Lachnospiraceae bacterium]|nr:S-layer homology domain-containing protein [Lachnospiraceae bacterium]